MKNKKTFLVTSLFISATLLSACSFNTDTIQRDFAKNIIDLQTSEYLSTTINIDTIIDNKYLSELSEVDKDNIKYLLKDKSFSVQYKKNKEQTEMILTIKTDDRLSNKEYYLDIPILIDNKNNKTYIGTDWIINKIELIYAESINQLASLYPENFKNYNPEEMRDLFNKQRTSSFVELDELKKTSILHVGEFDFDSFFKEIKANKYDNQSVKNKDIYSLLDKVDGKRFNSTNNSINLKLETNEVSNFGEKTNLFLYTNKGDLFNESNLEELIINNQYEKIDDVEINQFYNNKDIINNIDMKYVVYVGANNFKYDKSISYKDISFNKDEINFYHNIEELNILSDKQDIMGLDESINTLLLETFKVYQKLNGNKTN